MKKFKEKKCNLCGLSCVLGYKKISETITNHGLIDCEVQGGWFSTPGNGQGALDDFETYTFSLCEFCLDFLFENFVKPPKISCFLDRSYKQKFRPATKRVQEDEWRRFKDEFFEEKHKRDKKRKVINK